MGLSDSLKCEGLVIKESGSLYNDKGTRSKDWVKLKAMGNFQGEAGSMQDTLDLVPIGAYYGKGSRTGLFGSYLLASYNRLTGQFESVCKVGTGFKKE
mmetsp:Transcript_40678/g.62044  ORF Transcript_40678/g.62044 Transcript_40678/m.62044 type:complete len:98 (-) Transcript_40678:343-636(-)